ncbi:MAG: bifunctional glycosyltransferase family 2/GtrA family protein [Oscillospiraceae bacterium]|jgi:glycosyltransferase involved in cell wall biosynthesis|nr:bifunctional glycosyltransferase family 2/GtrA family protein [Oscillospiraceae bacterium]
MPDKTPDAFHAVVLIPAYKPDVRLPQLVELLRARGLDVLVVDDGGGEATLPIFQQITALGTPVVRHAVNLGKGRALKTGINEILLRWPCVSGVVTADADGQHTPDDILKVCQTMVQYPDTLVIGGRAFSGSVPWKSRAGNAITRVVYRLATGIRIHDTQTGLRGIPAAALATMVAMPGERYEYEMNMLLKLRDLALPPMEIPIETVYIDDNKGSHFNPLRDAARIYRVIFRYLLTALLSYGLDYALYLALRAWTGMELYLCYGVARVISSLFNYTLSKHAVFGGHGGKGAIFRYYLLMVVQMAVGAGLTQGLSVLPSALSDKLIKPVVDICLAVASYWVQREFVFRVKKKA